MMLFSQLALGTGLLICCLLIHVAAIGLALPKLKLIFSKTNHLSPALRISIILFFGLIVIVATHTIQVWSWAASFYVLNALDHFEAAFYFATVTYTTLGYGDLVLPEDLRVFGTFAALTGLFAFGVSTAYLIGIIMHLFPDDAPKTH